MLIPILMTFQFRNVVRYLIFGYNGGYYILYHAFDIGRYTGS